MKITIEGPDELIEMFGDLLGALRTIAQTVQVKVEPSPENDEKPAAVKAEQPVEQPTVTLEDARAKLADLSRNGKRDQVKSLIREFGAQKLTEVPKEKLPDLMAKAEAIA